MAGCPTVLLLASLLGCAEDADVDAVPVHVDDACVEADPGYDHPTDAAATAIWRVNCYRSLMGLSLGTLDPQLDAAAQAHADYMASNRILTHEEDAAAPGFTGAWVDDRAAAAGYPWTGGIMETVAWGVGAEEAVDIWVDSVYHRIPFTMPRWTAAGFGLAGQYSSMTIVHPFPGPAALVVFPVDGQEGVPATFNSDQEMPDPAPEHGVVGYPVTLTVAAERSAWGSNAYSVQLVEGWLSGPDGDLEVLLADPGTDPSLAYAVSLVPVAPLLPDTTYVAGFHLTWIDGEDTVTTSFTTAPAE